MSVNLVINVFNELCTKPTPIHRTNQKPKKKIKAYSRKQLDVIK